MKKETIRKPSSKRAKVAIGLFILLILIIISAIMIEIKEDDPQSFSIHVWKALHVVCGMVFTVYIIFHLTYNWKVFRNHLIRKNK